MIALERHEAILRELRLRGTLSAREFSERLGVASVTLRRDLKDLEDDGQLTRVHGGARYVQRSPAPAKQLSLARTRLAATFGVPPLSGDDETPVATIGMIAPTSSYYYAGAIEGAREAATLAGVRLVLAVSEYNELEERRIFERMLKIGLDGILITPAKSDLDLRPVRTLIESAPIPVTVLERIWEFPTGDHVVNSVRSDHAHGAEIAVTHLRSLGHRKLAIWSFDNPHVAEITDAFRAATVTSGGELHEPEFDYGHPDWNSVDTRANVERYLSEAIEAGVSAVLVHPDQLALQFAQVALERGLDIPGDMSVMAYDDEVAGLGELRLTAIEPPKRSIGFAAIDACLRSIAFSSGAPRAFPAQRIRLLPVLHVRDSTGAPGSTPDALP